MSDASPQGNYLGLDLRDGFIDKSKQAQLPLSRNLHYTTVNVQNLNFAAYFKFYPGPVAGLSILFPDPCIYKKRHVKRRMVSVEMLQRLALFLAQKEHDTPWLLVKTDLPAVR